MIESYDVRSILEAAQRIQREQLGKRTLNVSAFLFDEDININVTVFYGEELENFFFRSWETEAHRKSEFVRMQKFISEL